MTEDPIVQEVRRAREAYVERMGFDLNAIYRDIKSRERTSGRRLVSFASKPAITNDGPLAESIADH